ncbi:hypothetical protein IAT40_000889 [Kwoniella sp. CBS 6097]
MSTTAGTKDTEAETKPEASKKRESTVLSPNETSITWHHFHIDPRDKIILLSNDNLKFRASRTRLIDASLSFSDLMDTSRPERKTNEPIELDFPAEMISLFLDMASVCQPYIPQLSITTARSLLELLEFTLCDGLIDFARTSLTNAGSNQPLELLVIASDRNDIGLARVALRNATRNRIQSHICPNLSLSSSQGLKKYQEYLDRLQPAYQLELLRRTTLAGEYRENVTQKLQAGLYSTFDWISVADTFDPARFTDIAASPKADED